MAEPVPGDPENVSDPKYMLVYHTPTRAKPPVNYVTPNHEAKGLTRGQVRKPLVPQKAIRSGARGELALLRSKIEHCQLNSRLFCVAFSGIDPVRQPATGGTFFDFYFEHFCIHTFRMGQEDNIYVSGIRPTDGGTPSGYPGWGDWGKAVPTANHPPGSI